MHINMSVFAYRAYMLSLPFPTHSPPNAEYVRSLAISTTRANNACMTHYAITHRLTPPISMQNHYSLLYREEEREMFPTLKVRTS